VPTAGTTVGLGSLQDVQLAIQKLNIGYFWMLINCGTSAAYVRTVMLLDCAFLMRYLAGPYNAQEDKIHRVHGLGLDVLLKSVVNSRAGGFLDRGRRLGI
jgi:hypothetical protein